MAGTAAAAVAVQFDVTVDITCVNIKYWQDFVHQVELLGFDLVTAAVFVLIPFVVDSGIAAKAYGDTGIGRRFFAADAVSFISIAGRDVKPQINSYFARIIVFERRSNANSGDS